MEELKAGDIVECVEVDGKGGFLKQGGLYTVIASDPGDGLLTVQVTPTLNLRFKKTRFEKFPRQEAEIISVY